MKQIKINILPVRDSEQVSGVYVIQRKRSGAWTNERESSVVSGGPDRLILLDEDQRLVVEVKSNETIVYDAKQMAAVPRRGPLFRADELPDTDGEESPPVAAHIRAESGDEFLKLRREEEKAQLITAARQKIKAQQKPPESGGA